MKRFHQMIFASVGMAFAVGACGSQSGVATAIEPDPAGHAVSSRRYKRDIEYLSPSDAEELAAALNGIRLAAFRYKDGDKGRHLGFILEDSPEIPAADMARGRVDLYAYASMAVAAIQVQSRQIVQLEAEVDALDDEVNALMGNGPRYPESCLSSTTESLSRDRTFAN